MRAALARTRTRGRRTGGVGTADLGGGEGTGVCVLVPPPQPAETIAETTPSTTTITRASWFIGLPPLLTLKSGKHCAAVFSPDRYTLLCTEPASVRLE